MKNRKPKTVAESLIKALAGVEVEQPEAQPKAEDAPAKVEDSTEVPAKAEEGFTEGAANPSAQDKPKEDSGLSAVVSHLKEELTQLRVEHTKLVSEAAKSELSLKTLQASYDATKATCDKAMVSIREMTERLSIGLGQRIAGLESLSGESLLLQWSKVKADFDSRFVSGGKSRSEAEAAENDAEPSSPLVSRGVKATKLK